MSVSRTTAASPGHEPLASEEIVDSVLRLLGEDDTAVIVHDLDVLRLHLSALRRDFPESVDHAVAVKTMPHPQMLRTLVAEGFGLEAASFEEVELAAAAGAAPRSIIFDSPVKTVAEMSRCDDRFPGMLCNANSLTELGRYPDEPAVELGLRINPELSTDAPGVYAVSESTSKFGVRLSRRAEILDASLRSPFSALHMHLGSQVMDVEPHVAAASSLVRLADDIDEHRAEHGAATRVTTIDIGGGLLAEPRGVPGTPGSVMHRYGARLAEEVPALFARKVRTEFGQWLHAEAGWAASRVEYVEAGRRPRIYVHLGADLFVRDVYGTPREFQFAVRRKDGAISRIPETEYDVAGPLCFAGDMLGRALPLPRVEEGDWLIIEGTGANTYGLWSRHCSRAIPAVVAVEGSVASLWSRRSAVF